MAVFVAAPIADLMNVDKRRHPAIFGEAPSSGQLGEPQIDAIYLLDAIYLGELQASATSETIRREQLYSKLRDDLRLLERLEAGWEHEVEAPTHLARREAERALEIFKHLNAEPVAVLPSVDGGVGICFNNREKYGQVEFLNNGEAHALLYGGPVGAQAWQINLGETNALREAWKRISVYL